LFNTHTCQLPFSLLSIAIVSTASLHPLIQSIHSSIHTQSSSKFNRWHPRPFPPIPLCIFVCTSFISSSLFPLSRSLRSSHPTPASPDTHRMHPFASTLPSDLLSLVPRVLERQPSPRLGRSHRLLHCFQQQSGHNSQSLPLIFLGSEQYSSLSQLELDINPFFETLIHHYLPTRFPEPCVALFSISSSYAPFFLLYFILAPVLSRCP